MKRKFTFFAIIWAILFVVFNAITFIIPNKIFDVNRFELTTFWIGYALVVVGFAMQLLTAGIFCKGDSADKMFLHMPLLLNGYVALGVTFAVGTTFSVIAPLVPAWIAGIVSVLVTAYFLIAGICAKQVATHVTQVEEKIKVQTQTIRQCTVEAEIIAGSATNSEIKAEAKKVYEAIRYSDPMSTEALASIDQQIVDKLAELKAAVGENNLENTQATANALLLLVKERNLKCKMMK